jgi:hypothetical protein
MSRVEGKQQEAADWREAYAGQIETPEQFVTFLDAVGLCLWSPLPRGDFPNLTEKLAVPPTEAMNVTWFWKDDLHTEKRLYYGKLLGGNATFVSMAMLPALIAAQGDVDPYNLHEEGRLTPEALRIYEALQEHRQLSTRDLRREAKLAGTSDKAAFEKGLTALMALFQICKTELTGRTRGTYSYVWGLTEDWVPEALDAAAKLRPEEAARHIIVHLTGWRVRLEERMWQRLFGWRGEMREIYAPPLS